MATASEELVWEIGQLHRRMREVVTGLTAEQLDLVPTEGANSIAVLVTHTLASELGWLHLAAGREFKRDRDSEFAVRASSSEDLKRSIDETEGKIPDLIGVSLAAGLDTQRERPGARSLSVGYCLAHALAHAAEHVGQAELTRQFVTAKT